jgi:exodeoxyribonuclease VII large subunit
MQTELFESFEDSTDILSVSQLTKEIKSLLETSLPPLWVRGEISNLRVQSSGHRYFILKDQNSQLKTVLFKGNFQNSGYIPSDGDECLAYGNINVYEPRGDYQFRVKHIMQDGTGMLRLQFDRLKEKLLADGIFDDHNKTPLPTYAQNIAIITSPKGAALQDFISILNRKNWTGKISIFPSSVQGKEAPSELLHSLKLIEKYQHYDLVVLARGGGSIEDLWAFNNERLVRSVADFNMPIISAIGHQTDFVLTDFASDFRAETPSAAAEWICNLHRNQEEHLNDLAKQLTDLPKRKIEQHTEKLNLATMRLRNCSPKSRVEVFHQYLDEFSNRMDTRILHTIDQNKLKVSSLGKRLESNSLKSVLNRGFAFFEGQDGKTLENAKMLKKGETVKAVFKDGKKDLEVKN